MLKMSRNLRALNPKKALVQSFVVYFPKAFNLSSYALKESEEVDFHTNKTIDAKLVAS